MCCTQLRDEPRADLPKVALRKTTDWRWLWGDPQVLVVFDVLERVWTSKGLLKICENRGPTGCNLIYLYLQRFWIRSIIDSTNIKGSWRNTAGTWSSANLASHRSYRVISSHTKTFFHFLRMFGITVWRNDPFHFELACVFCCMIPMHSVLSWSIGLAHVICCLDLYSIDMLICKARLLSAYGLQVAEQASSGWCVACATHGTSHELTLWTLLRSCLPLNVLPVLTATLCFWQAFTVWLSCGLYSYHDCSFIVIFTFICNIFGHCTFHSIFESLWQISFAPKRLDPFWHVSLNPLFFWSKKINSRTNSPNNNSKKPLSGSPAGAALFESAGGGAAAGATGGAGARHAGAETRRVVPRRVKTETEETWRWPDVVDILTCGDGRCGMMVVSLVALLFDDFWSMSQLGRLALLGVEIVLSGVVRAKGPALPPWLPRLHGFSDHDKSERVKLL